METFDMNKPVVFQRQVELPDRPPLGEVPNQWEPVFSEPVYASIRTVGTREKMRAGAVQMTMTHTLGTRYHPDIASRAVGDMRAIYNGRIFNIQGVTNVDERDEWLVFDCEEGSQVGK